MIKTITVLFLNMFLLATTSGAQCKLTVSIEGFENQEGNVRVALFRSTEGFPSDPKKAYKVATTNIKDKKATVIFTEIPAGTYAVSVLHDANSNGKLDTNWLLGTPTEGTGASNNARGTMGPPKFKDAAFNIVPAELTIKIKMRYY